MSEIVEAAGMLIVTRQTPPSLLLMQHRERWDLPKGHADLGESTLQTALRETAEETGLSATQIHVDPDFQVVLEYLVEGKRRGRYYKRVTYFLGYIEAQQDIVLTEHIGYHWLPLPVQVSVQEQTIDPLIQELQRHCGLKS